MIEPSTRSKLVAVCQSLQADGLMTGTSGNVSVRLGAQMLITPSGVSADELDLRMVSRMRLDGDRQHAEGPLPPSSEWRIHRDLMRARPEIGAVVHTHAPFSTILAILRRPIPAVHYMIAAFGGADIRVADYATFGTPELSQNVLAAMEDRKGCLMANHGMIVVGETLERAAWRARELEALANQYYHVLSLEGGHVLDDEQIAETALRFETYGRRVRDAG